MQREEKGDENKSVEQRRAGSLLAEGCPHCSHLPAIGVAVQLWHCLLWGVRGMNCSPSEWCAELL